MMSRRRGRGRGGICFPKPPVVSEESKPGEDTVVGPPPLFPEFKKFPEIPKIDNYGEELLARWHKFRHVCRSGPYYLENPELPETADVDHFSVKKYSDKEVSKPKRPTIESVMDLSVHYFPVELTSKRQRDESSHRATQEKGLDSSWSARVLNQAEEEYTKFEEAAKKAENDKKADSDEEGNELPEDRAEDEYSQDDYQQGEYFDDDEGYDEYEDAGDEGPVY